MQLTLAEIADLVAGRVAGDGGRSVSGVAALEAAGPDDISFVADEQALVRLADSRAGAVVIKEGLEGDGRDAVFHANPHAAMAVLIRHFHPQRPHEPGISPQANVHPDARIGEDVSVAAFAVIEAGAEIGARCRIGPHAVVGSDCRVGESTVLRAHAVLYAGTQIGRECIVHAGAVLGATGFGYTVDGGRHVGIPQVGGLVIGDDVEIGANTCIDCGTLSPTRIGDNTKIDDQVMLGHNCQVGSSVILCGQTAFAGSTVIEDWAVFAGGAGSAGHLRVGKGATVAGRSVVTGDVDAGATVAGYPHMDLTQWRRMAKAARDLPEMRATLRELRKRVADLEARLEDDDA